MIRKLNWPMIAALVAVGIASPGLSASAQQRPATTATPGGPAVVGSGAPTVSPGSGIPSTGGGGGSLGLQPSIVAPAAPIPQASPQVARPAVPTNVARRPRAWCIVRPLDQSCRAVASADGGGDSGDTDCRCGRDRCERQLSTNGVTQLVCFK